MNKKDKVSSTIILLTVLVIAILGYSYWISKSIVIQAELYDSIVDLMYSIIIVGGFLLSKRDRDPKYPEGLIRLEPIIASFVGFIVIGSGFYIIYESISNLQGSSSTEFKVIVLLLILLSMLVKLFLFLYVRKQSRELDSSSLYATSVDLRNDVLTHITSMIGYLFVLTPFVFLESVIAIIISGYIMFSGLLLLRNNIPSILGSSVEEDEKEKLEQVALSHNSVYGVHDYEIHFTGDLIDISMHLEVRGDMSISEGHQVEVEVADKLREKSKYRVNEINIHLDPDDIDEWKPDY